MKQDNDSPTFEAEMRRREVQFYRLVGTAFIGVAITLGGAAFGFIPPSGMPFSVAPAVRAIAIVAAVGGLVLTLVFAFLTFRNIAREDRIHRSYLASWTMADRDHRGE